MPAPGDPNTQRPGAPAFADGIEARAAPGVIENQIARLAQEAEPALAAMLASIEQLLSESTSLADFRDRLLNQNPQLDTAAFAQVMQQALAAAALAGRYDILEQARGG